MPGLLQAISIAPCSSAAVYVNTGSTPAAVSLNVTSLCSTLNNTLTVGIYNSTACPCSTSTIASTTFSAPCIGAISVDNSSNFVGQSYSGEYNTHPCFYSAACATTGTAGLTICNYYPVLTNLGCFVISNLNFNGWPIKIPGLTSGTCCCNFYTPNALYASGITSLTNSFRINYAAASIKCSMNQIYTSGLSIAPIATGCAWGSGLGFVCACSTCNLTWTDAAVLNSCRMGGLLTTCASSVVWASCVPNCACLCCNSINYRGTSAISKVAADIWSDTPTIWQLSFENCCLPLICWQIANLCRTRCDFCPFITSSYPINRMGNIFTNSCQSSFWNYCCSQYYNSQACPCCDIATIFNTNNSVHAGCRLVAFTPNTPLRCGTYIINFHPCMQVQGYSACGMLSLAYARCCCSDLANIGSCHKDFLIGMFNSSACGSYVGACGSRMNFVCDGTVKWMMYDHINDRNIVYVDSCCNGIAGIYKINNTGYSTGCCGVLGCYYGGNTTGYCTCGDAQYSWTNGTIGTKLSGTTCSGGYIPCDDLNAPYAYVTMPYMYSEGLWESYRSCYNSNCGNISFCWNGCMLRFTSMDLVTWTLSTGASRTYICDVTTGMKTSYNSVAGTGVTKTIDNFFNVSCFSPANYIENRTTACNLQRTGLVIGTNQSIIVANDSAACVAAQVWGVN